MPWETTEILSANSKEAEHHNVLLDGGDFFVQGDKIFLGQGHGSNNVGGGPVFLRPVTANSYGTAE
jgi:hypothetical protein